MWTDYQRTRDQFEDHMLSKGKECKCTRSNTSQLLTDPRTGLRFPAGAPSIFSLRRHSSSVLKSSVGQSSVRACSCSKDSELWTPREHSWSWASANLQLEMMDAFKQHCWLWHNDDDDDDDDDDGRGGDGHWCKVSGRIENNIYLTQQSCTAAPSALLNGAHLSLQRERLRCLK